MGNCTPWMGGMDMALLCCRCHKNRAVLFVTRMDNGEMKNEGYCLKCAKELGLKPVDDLLENMGLQDADLDALCEQANQMGELMNVDENAANIGQTGVGNFFRQFFGNMRPRQTPQNGAQNAIWTWSIYSRWKLSSQLTRKIHTSDADIYWRMK